MEIYLNSTARVTSSGVIYLKPTVIVTLLSARSSTILDIPKHTKKRSQTPTIIKSLISCPL